MQKENSFSIGEGIVFIHDMTSPPPFSHGLSQIPVSRTPVFSSIPLPNFNASLVHCACANSICIHLYRRCPAVARKCLRASLLFLGENEKCFK
ncbi:hypothetical protein CEXT_578851 [Caerostris extrusa]|uniref:Uncharacterized protein n=1 Tax=Caerostris extrusa TaxID=172846 RepID=A0AAV4N749_CAEEX|nr:hypothetical protein CEXT_578851 [Caerostris extrusa]